jgi:hypothetical protein
MDILCPCDLRMGEGIEDDYEHEHEHGKGRMEMPDGRRSYEKVEAASRRLSPRQCFQPAILFRPSTHVGE